MPQDHFEGEFAYAVTQDDDPMPTEYVWGRCTGTATRREDQCRTWLVVRRGDAARCRFHQEEP